VYCSSPANTTARPCAPARRARRVANGRRLRRRTGACTAAGRIQPRVPKATSRAALPHAVRNPAARIQEQRIKQTSIHAHECTTNLVCARIDLHQAYNNMGVQCRVDSTGLYTATPACNSSMPRRYADVHKRIGYLYIG
jgi:hypothetical protein